MAYSKTAHDLLDSTLKVMVNEMGQDTAFATMLGYLLPNIDLETAIRISKLADKKVEVSK